MKDASKDPSVGIEMTVNPPARKVTVTGEEEAVVAALVVPAEVVDTTMIVEEGVDTTMIVEEVVDTTMIVEEVADTIMIAVEAVDTIMIAVEVVDITMIVEAVMDTTMIVVEAAAGGETGMIEDPLLHLVLLQVVGLNSISKRERLLSKKHQ